MLDCILVTAKVSVNLMGSPTGLFLLLFFSQKQKKREGERRGRDKKRKKGDKRADEGGKEEKEGERREGGRERERSQRGARDLIQVNLQGPKNLSSLPPSLPSF